mgnify:CR=1 FL=1
MVLCVPISAQTHFAVDKGNTTAVKIGFHGCLQLSQLLRCLSFIYDRPKRGLLACVLLIAVGIVSQNTHDGVAMVLVLKPGIAGEPAVVVILAHEARAHEEQIVHGGHLLV